MVEAKAMGDLSQTDFHVTDWLATQIIDPENKKGHSTNSRICTNNSQGSGIRNGAIDRQIPYLASNFESKLTESFNRNNSPSK